MNHRKRRGIVLVLVLVVVAILAISTLSFCDLMLNQRRATQTSGQQIQTRVLAESGAELARQFLDRNADDRADAGGIYDNSRRFRDVVVDDAADPRDRGRFTIVAPRIEDRVIVGMRYGLQDESTRLNLRTILQMDKKSPGAAKTMLMGLPGMTEEISDAILDWIDADDTARDQGAEAEYYASLTPPYAPRNAPPESIEELLLVRGVTPQLLFGLDATRLGYAASSSADGTIEGVDNSDGSMDHGWAAYLTLYSAESNVKSDGTAKIDLNGDDLQKLYDDLKTALDDQSAMFIVAYRAYGASTSGATGTANSASNAKTLSPDQFDVSKLKATATLTSVLDLIGVTVEVPAPQASQGNQGTPGGQGQGGQNQPGKSQVIRLQSPFTEDAAAMGDYLPKLMAATTVQSGASVAGRININQATRTVLLCIPGMTSDIVDQIISKRVLDPTSDDLSHHYETWLLSDGIVPLKTMKSLLPLVTAGGSVYRAQIIGALDGGGPAARLEVIFDAGKPPTRLLFWKDVSGLSGGFPAEAAAPASSVDK
jgi:hypothetical protein